MSTLTERYLWAALRTVPEKQRAELEPEIRELIADSIDAQQANGATDSAAERAALIELGDPARLAARYLDRPLQLIGPRYYLDWLRLLKLLLWIVVPIAAVAAGAARFFAGAGTDGGSPFDLGDAIGAMVATAIGVGVHLCFWVTLVFVIVERSGTARDKPLLDWTPEALPQLPTRSKPALSDMIVSLAFLAFFGGWIIWQNFHSFFTDAAGNPIPLFSPELWSNWLPYFLAILVLEMAFAVWLYVRGRWTLTLAFANLALNVVFAVPAVWLVLTGQLINPEFLAAVPLESSVQLDGVSEESVRTTIAASAVPITLLFVLGIALWDTVDGFIKTWRARSQSPARR